MSTNSQLKILHISKGYPPEIGGIEVCVRDLAEAQVAAGHDVRVLAHAGKVPAGNEEIAGVKLQRCRTWGVIGRYAPLAPGLIWQCWKNLLHSSFRPDVVHLHYPNPAAMWLWPRFPAKLVVHWHADVTFPPEESPSPHLLTAWRWFESRLLHRADRVIATSYPYLEASKTLHPFRSKCTVVPLGLKPAAGGASSHHPVFSFFDKEHDLRVLAVGRLVSYKGFRFLIEALHHLPEMCLCIVGDGEEMPHLQRLVAQHHLEKCVHLHGSIPDSRLRELYQQCDVFVLPSISRSEAFGLVLLEAMREGKPCIASNVHGSGMVEIVQHGVTGILTTPCNVAELVAALRMVADAPEQLSAMGEAGRKRQAEKYTLEVMANSIEDVYASVLSPTPEMYSCC